MTLVKNLPPSKNGKPATTHPTGTSAPQPEAKDLKSKPIPLTPEAATNDSPLEDRVLKVQQLSDLVQKRDKLQISLKKLQSINTSTESRDLKITIEDSENEWETYNSEAIKMAVDTLITAHKQRIAALEEKICW